MCLEAMNKEDSLIEKKLRGSGGFVIAKITDDEQRMANLGGPELFLAGIGRLDENRFEKYYCNKCEKDYQGAPNLIFENPNEDLGENIILKEKGEYKCKSCNYIIAQYRKFDDLKKNEETSFKKIDSEDKISKIGGGKGEEKGRKNDREQIIETENSLPSVVELGSGYIPIENIIGMPAYDSNAYLVGKVNEIGLRKISIGKIQFSFKIIDSNNKVKEIMWEDISKIGDIIILGKSPVDNKGNIQNTFDEEKDSNESLDQNFRVCRNCNYSNEQESVFCEECGKKLE